MSFFQPEEQTDHRRDDHPEEIFFTRKRQSFCFFTERDNFFVFYRKRQSFLSFIVRDPVFACF